MGHTYQVVKAHADGNDFLYVRASDITGQVPEEFARMLCARHTGVGADGLIVFSPTLQGASMRLFNADGSYAEVSGNGVRGLAALLVRQRTPAEVAALLEGRSTVVIDTDAGQKTLQLLATDGTSSRFRAAMGDPTEMRSLTLEIDGEPVEAVAMRMGNPQCVVLAASLDERRLRLLGPAVQRLPQFPEGTNFELASVEAPNLVRILIWERGVGPTTSSGTGACAAAATAMVHGNADRSVEVVSPGGSQHVDWRPDGLYLTGWAHVVLDGQWLQDVQDSRTNQPCHRRSL